MSDIQPTDEECQAWFGWIPHCLWCGKRLIIAFHDVHCPTHGGVSFHYVYRGPEALSDRYQIGVVACLAMQLECLGYLKRTAMLKDGCRTFAHPPIQHWCPVTDVYEWEDKQRCAACIARGFRSPLYPTEMASPTEGTCSACSMKTMVLALSRDLSWCWSCLLAQYRQTWQEPTP